MAIVPNRYLQPQGGPFAQMGPGGVNRVSQGIGQGFMPGGFAGGVMRRPGLGGIGGPMSIYANPGMFGQGGHDTLHDLLGGIDQQQLDRMQHGMNPGGFHGDFVGMSPARLKLLAGLMVANQQSGPAGNDNPATYALQYRRGDGLFAGRKMPIRQGMTGGPVREQPLQGGMRHMLMQMAMQRALGR